MVKRIFNPTELLLCDHGLGHDLMLDLTMLVTIQCPVLLSNACCPMRVVTSWPTCCGIESVAWHPKIVGRRSFGPNKTGPH